MVDVLTRRVAPIHHGLPSRPSPCVTGEKGSQTLVSHRFGDFAHTQRTPGLVRVREAPRSARKPNERRRGRRRPHASQPKNWAAGLVPAFTRDRLRGYHEQPTDEWGVKSRCVVYQLASANCRRLCRIGRTKGVAARHRKCPFAGEKLEAAIGVEPMMEVLQSSRPRYQASPLGSAGIRSPCSAAVFCPRHYLLSQATHRL